MQSNREHVMHSNREHVMHIVDRPHVNAVAALIFAAFIAVLATFAPPAMAEIVRAVEYYHQAFEHYFVTANPAEIAALDSGAVSGWWRTGQRYRVDDAPAEGLVPVCRFFTSAYANKASHFFTASAAECAHVKTMPDWTYEGVAFYARVPDAQWQCPAGTTPILRLFNNGQGGAPNHAYTANDSMWLTLLDAGWWFEGVAYCTPLAAGDPWALSGSKWNLPWPAPLGRFDPMFEIQFTEDPGSGRLGRLEHFILPPPEEYFLFFEKDFFRPGSNRNRWGVATWDPVAGSYFVVSESEGEYPAWTFDAAEGPSTPVCAMRGSYNEVSQEPPVLHRFQQILYSGCEPGVANRH